MPLYGSADNAGSKPKFLTAAEKTTCLAADATETAASSKIMHQGWTVPRAGSAMRETLVAMNIVSDIGTSDDTDLGLPEAGTRYVVTLKNGSGWSAGMGGYGIVALILDYPDEATADAEIGVYKGNSPIQTANGLKIYTGSNMSVGPQTSDGYNLDGSVKWEAHYQWDGMTGDAMLSFYGGPVSGAAYSNMPIQQAGSMGSVAGSHGEVFYNWIQSSPGMGTTIQIAF